MTGAMFYPRPASDDTLGGRMSLARDTLGLSVEDVALLLGVEAGTLRYWENDQAEPRGDRLSLLADVLQVSLSWLLTGFGQGADWKDVADVPPLAPHGLRPIPSRH
jgi:transcriptional regulator with XRE-family HTH domain